jgi:hypothetical protein
MSQGLAPVVTSRTSLLYLYLSELPFLLILFSYFDLYFYLRSTIMKKELRNVFNKSVCRVNDNFKCHP